MQLLLKIFYISFFSFFLNFEVLPIQTNEVYKICRKEKKVKDCVNRIKINRDLLKKGKPIEIPVIPFRKK